MATNARKAIALLVALLGLGVAGVVVGALVLASSPAVKRVLAEWAGPKEAVVDEEYRFRLEAPRGWRLLGREDARRLTPEARAGAMSGKGECVVVLVEYAPGAELEGYARLLLDNMTLEDKKEVSFRRETFLGKDAVRFELTGTTAELKLRYDATVFLHQGHGYQVLGWGLSGKTTVGGSWIEPMRRSFALLDGEVRNAVETQVATDSYGVGWRVKDGLFESAILGVVVHPPEGWGLAVGDEVRRMYGDAEVALLAQAPDVYFTLSGERVSAGREDTAITAAEEHVVSSLHLVPAEPGELLASWFGSPLTLRSYRGKGALPMSYLHGGRCEAGHCLRVLAWYLTAIESSAETRVGEALGAIRKLSEGERQTLLSKLAALPDPESDVGQDYSLRAGAFRSFEHGLVWHKPPGFWRAATGESARALAAGAILGFSSPEHGLRGLAMSEATATGDPMAFHFDVLNVIGGQPPRGFEPEALKLGAAEGLVSVVEPPGELRYLVATSLWKGRGYRMVVWGAPEHFELAGAAVEDALRAFRFQPKLEVEDSAARRFRDLRMGYQLELPPGEWGRDDRTPPDMAARASLRAWTSGKSTLLVMAVEASSTSQTAEWFEGIVGELFQRELGAGGLGGLVRSEATVAGTKATHFSRSAVLAGTVDVFLLSRRSTLYALVVTAQGLGAKAPVDSLAAGFTLIE
ncbi:MAG: hypothetical protein HYZ28_03340 [Myxococcales bacterium]|nr:hypothetical protein [Myxococcales bacterium]